MSAILEGKISVIEGIGDEVLQFFSVLMIVVLLIVAWWSTNIRESFHTTPTMQELARRSWNRTLLVIVPSTAPVLDTTTNRQRASNGDMAETWIDDSQEKGDNLSPTVCTNEGVTVIPSTEATRLIPEEGSGTEEPQQELSSRELNPKKMTGPFLTAQPSSEAGNPLPETMRSIVAEQRVIESDQIRIRLKYLNDDQKFVEGRLEDRLGEFKRRHFSTELSADKLVRLIFNGQILDSEQKTLQVYGLYDNCVVHCLVNSRRSPTTPTNIPASPHQSPDCNLSPLLHACLSLILSFLWYCRYQYAQIFTLTATVTLIVLTASYYCVRIRHLTS